MTRRRGAAVAAAVLVAALVVAVVVLRVRSASDGSSGEVGDVPRASASTSAPAPARDVKGVLGRPDRLRIDAIDVDAPVIGVGTAADSSQEVPSSIDETGWWRDGQEPGQAGNAVVVGHTASQGDGVFDRLDDVDRGDVVTVLSGRRQLRFRVTGTETVPVSQFGRVADRVYRSSGPRGLVLMTCGDWNGRVYESTVIVSTKAV